MILAGVDIGTLTCRLLIANVGQDGSLSPVYSERRIDRLGEGLDRHRRLDPSAMARVLNTLHDWRKTIDATRVDREVVVATSAVRAALNRQEFVDLVTRETGFKVEVISGEEEARRTLLGIRSGLPAGTGDILGLDIGGGSTEFIVDRQTRPPEVHSIELGVVRVTERVFKHDPPTDAERRAAGDLIIRESKAVQALLGDVDRTTFVGTAGSITTLAAIAQNLPVYDPARIHNYTLDVETVRRIEEHLFTRTSWERRGMPGLEPGREDVILAGTVILRAIMEVLGRESCLVSEFGLREGVLIDCARRAA